MEPIEHFVRLLQVMSRLRGPGGCPWDLEQTSKSIAPYCLEEAYEVVDAIDEGDPEKLRDELGDLLLQVIFHSQIAREEGKFAIGDVIESLNNKLVRRHPHVFNRRGDDKTENASTSSEVLENWAKIKKKEGREHLLDGIPKALPALMRATRMGEKASGVGFDWDSPEEVWKKVDEELVEVQKTSNPMELEGELGDLLFTLANYARHKKIDAEAALRKSTEKFETRFRKMEMEARQKNKELQDCSAKELDELWNQAKKT